MVRIHEIASKGDLSEIKQLIRKDVELLDMPNVDGWPRMTPLMYAAEAGHAEVVAFFLDHGADIDYRDVHGCTALYEASSSGHSAVVSLLVERGADASIASNYGRTPLMEAAQRGHTEVVSVLLRHAASVGASANGKGKGKAENADVGVDSTDSRGHTALWYACSKGRTEATALLLEAGADPTVVDKDGWTVADAAKMKGGHEGEGCIQLIKEWSVAYGVTKARRVLDSLVMMTQHPAIAKADTNDQAKQMRLKVTPAYLKYRVEQDEQLPVFGGRVALPRPAPAAAARAHAHDNRTHMRTQDKDGHNEEDNKNNNSSHNNLNTHNKINRLEEEDVSVSTSVLDFMLEQLKPELMIEMGGIM